MVYQMSHKAWYAVWMSRRPQLNSWAVSQSSKWRMFCPLCQMQACVTCAHLCAQCQQVSRANLGHLCVDFCSYPGWVVSTSNLRLYNKLLLPNPSNHTMDLALTQFLTEMSTRRSFWGKAWLAHKADNLTAICEPIVQKMWEPQRLTTLWASTACYRASFAFFYFF
jgi:hypothetical protein